MRLSLITPVLNSHEILRRQYLWWSRMGLPKNVEILVIDDGSDPPLSQVPNPGLKNLRVIETGDSRPWTWALARNRGAREARGDYFLMFDIDYIIPYGVIDVALYMTEDRMNFIREFAVLDSEGCLVQTYSALRQHGLTETRIQDRGFKVSAHTNDFVMSKKAYWELGGYPENLFMNPYPQGEDRRFQKRWDVAQREGRVTRTYFRPTVYMFPTGKFCENKLDTKFFHNLKRG